MKKKLIAVALLVSAVALGQAANATDAAAYCTDLAATAAIIEQLDLVITIDTAVAHLAGALGKPTWLLLSAAPDWRWMLGRSDSPWYPSMRLFRQAKLGDWSDPLAKLRAELARTV